MTEQTPDRAKLLDKIQKCLRLSKSSEPHEAAAAMRQAQKLMQLHSITEQELLGTEVQSSLFITREPYKKKLPMYLSYLISTISKAFEVEAVIEYAWVKGKSRLAVRYFGIMGRNQLAEYTHEVMMRQLRSAWSKYVKDHPWANGEKGARQGFWVGWLIEVRGKVIAFGGSEEEKETTTKAVAAYYGRPLGTSQRSKMTISGATAAAGRQAAEDFSIHRPMNGERQRAIGRD